MTLVFHDQYFRFQHWIQITTEFNSRTTNGGKCKKQLIDKYRNGKSIFKQAAANDAREIRATGGGKATLLSEKNPYNFSDRQLIGYENPYDNDAKTSEIVNVDGEEYEIANLNDSTKQEPANAVSIIHVEQDGRIIPIDIEVPEKLNSIKLSGQTPKVSSSSILSKYRGKTPKTDDAREFAEMRKRKAVAEVELLAGEKEIQELKKKKLEVEIDSLRTQMEYQRLKMEWYRQDIRTEPQQDQI